MPDTTVVKNALLQLDRLAAGSWHLFEPLLQEVHFDTGDYLAHSGRISTAIYFITSGIVRVFATNADKEVSLDFAFAGQFSTAYASFITQTPSAVSLQAITPVTGFAFYYDDLQALYRKDHQVERTGRLLAEYQYLRKYHRELSFLQYSAQERYLQLLNEHPQIVQQIPVKYIASYLGIEPESLSRIRKNLK
ncbi:cAMP-binding domain of CRP or a regulatory subunit of cAMP-dependent protein kinases [Chitinophaga sp. CF118]|uniref:Crp/Fnr family transcriptional regulator n=1 Tax=Chitinophaga sp. CF118 TaxID=1884367 RepID=UPI0008EE1FEB|nr:Crp/Fnr family transcriptional regulator [Chitinophaga sp. CF118]SFE04581.1 cAMP-binding domain of CRP or a regulatory subunit of cAMP-dependent protein kinases [Chitinophaga sp. CF118]